MGASYEQLTEKGGRVMRKSILQEEKCCWFCLSTQNLEYHHIFFGTANRKISDKHHTGSLNSVHRSVVMDLSLKRACQLKYEQTHSREDFIKLIGRNYL